MAVLKAMVCQLHFQRSVCQTFHRELSMTAYSPQLQKEQHIWGTAPTRLVDISPNDYRWDRERSLSFVV